MLLHGATLLHGMNSSPDSPVIIIGASLAGCTTALRLSARGIPVLLIDKASFPRRKACGEGLSARGIAELRRLGFDVLAECPEYAWLEGYRVRTKSFPFDITDGNSFLGVKRAALDAALLEQVRSYPSATVLTGSSVSDIEVSRDRFIVSIGDSRISASKLVIADGANSRMLARLGYQLPESRPRRVGSSSAWTVAEGKLPPFVQVFVYSGGEVYLTPTGPGDCNLSLLGTPEFVAQWGREKELTRWVSTHRDVLSARLELESAPLGAGPLNTSRRTAAWRGAFVVGDACETLDPIGGMGMTHAIISGRLAGDAVARALRIGESTAASAWYQREHAAVVRAMRGFTRMTGWMLASAAGQVALPLAVSSGLARRVSHAAHGEGTRSGWKVLLQAAGR